MLSGNRLCDALTQTGQIFIGGKWTSRPQEELFCLAPQFGGLGLRHVAADIYGAAAFWTTWLPSQARAAQTAEGAGTPMRQIAGSNAVDLPLCQLAQQGVHRDRSGTVRLNSSASQLFSSSPLAADVSAYVCNGTPLSEVCLTLHAPSPTAPPPKARIAGRLWRALEALQAARLFPRLSDTQREAVLSGDGKLGGSAWLAPPESSSEWLPDAHFRPSTQLRLAALEIAHGSTCCLVSRDKE